MSKATKRTTLTQKEIAVAINNAFSAASNSTATIKQTDAKKRALRHYTLELAEILWSDVEEEGLLKAEELVSCLCGAALFIHAAKIMKTTKIPMMADMMARTLEDEAEDE